MTLPICLHGAERLQHIYVGRRCLGSAFGGSEYDPDNTGDIFGLEPYYIRRSEAEELWEKRQQE
mgnify:FL=1